MQLSEKVAKARNRVEKLAKQKNELDSKIKKAEADLLKYENMMNQQKFDEMKEVIYAHGLTLEEVQAAVKSGNLSCLQERISVLERNE